MALFIKRDIIFEAEGDENTEGENNTTGGEAEAQDNNSNTDNTSDNETENTEDQGSNEDEEKDNADDEDYSIDSDPDEDDDANSDDENSNDDTDSDDFSSGDDDDMNSDNDSSGEDSEEKQMDREMFSTLSEDEQKRKIQSLKKLYIDLYGKAEGLIQKFNQVGFIDDEDFGPIAKRILNILYEMKQYVSDYVLNIYDKSSYIENDITFNRYLCVLDGIKLAVEELDKQINDDEKGKK